MESPAVHADMAQYFDFGEASGTVLAEQLAGTAGEVQTELALVSPSSNETNEGSTSTCNGENCDVDAGQPLESEYTPPEWNPDFSSWMPQFCKPVEPCDYCRSRKLECFLYDHTLGTGVVGCSPCKALFRPCSFSEPKNQKSRSKAELDTLHVVDEAGCTQVGGITGKKPLRSLGYVGPMESPEDDNAPKKGAAAARFPRAAVKILKEWMTAHSDHPYPTEEEKEELKSQTGLGTTQISNWMANTRRRQKIRATRGVSPSVRPSTAINIPAGRTWESLNPLERWKHSPPENEPAPLNAIAKAVETFDPPEPNSLSSSFNGRKGNSNESSGSFSVFRAPSTTSLETGFTNGSSGSMQSHGTAWSHGSRNSFGSLNSSIKGRRRRRVPPRAPVTDSILSVGRIFQCTFCTDSFKSKYDWSRHEKSLHISLEKWICAPLGEVVTCDASGQRKCVYCDAIEPSQEHLDTHNHKACQEKGHEARTFYRKDHLRQHLRLMHGCKMIPSMDSWKSEAPLIRSRCGFCGMTFEKWQDRVDHLAKEYRNGANIRDWKGCRGLDPHVAAIVTNAMPPYLIANEIKSPNPFSATNAQSMATHNICIAQGDLEYLIPYNKLNQTEGTLEGNNSSNRSSLSGSGGLPGTPQYGTISPQRPSLHPDATCWEILTLRLGRYAREHSEKHGKGSITDEMLQQEARRILYGSDDAWEQTAADNPEWLGLFKKAHGLDGSALPVGKQRHELLEDLGINEGAVSHLDPSFDLSFYEFQDRGLDQSLAYECSLGGTLKVSQTAHQLAAQFQPNMLPTTSSTGLLSLWAPIQELACTKEGDVCVGENGEFGFATQKLDGSQNCSRYRSSLADTMNISTSTIPEIPCTTSGNALSAFDANTFNFSTDFPSWNHLPEDLVPPPPTTTTNHANFNTTGVDFGGNFGNGAVSGVDAMQGMAWDEAELGFSMDLDLDVDMGNSRY